MIKALFFDIDGTLVSFATHRIPASTVDALTLAKAKGVKIFIATGRAYQLITNLGDIKELIDGYITTNGAYNFMQDGFEQLFPIAHADVELALCFLRSYGYSCMVVGRDDLAFFNRNRAIEQKFEKMLDLHFTWSDKPVGEIARQGVFQLTPIVNEEEERRMMSQLHDSISSRWCPYFADITARGVDKGNGMKAICEHIGLGLGETMAFGDGGNDLSMLRTAGIGVAMGNANESLKPHADYVTASVDDDGVARALAHFGVV